MPHINGSPATSDLTALDVEIMQLRTLDLDRLRARWQTVFRRRPPSHLPRHLLFRMLVYQMQVARLGGLDIESRRLLDGAALERDDNGAVTGARKVRTIAPGTIVAREWDGKMQRVTVLNDGFAWNGKSYRSLSKIALVITGTRWNGPRFFGLRDRHKQPDS